MNRWKFIAALFGIGTLAKAQEQIPIVSNIGFLPSLWVENREIHWFRDKKPLNNQCPVCGTMAAPFHRDLVVNGLKFREWEQRNAGGDFQKWAKENGGIPTGPVENLTRCARCNAAFWQDAQ